MKVDSEQDVVESWKYIFIVVFYVLKVHASDIGT